MGNYLIMMRRNIKFNTNRKAGVR